MVLLLAVPASGHDYSLYDISFSDFTPQDFVHEDADLWAGWLNLTVTNSGNQPWGGFHFEIYDPIGDQDISNIHWIDDPSVPYSTQDPLTWTIDNDVVGPSIDLLYLADPVQLGETVEFHVFNVNPDQVPFFGVSLCPTPVPETGTLGMLTLATLVVAVAARRFALPQSRSCH
jgi:hypothetical protein